MASLDYCRSELQSIINELRDIEWELRHCARNVGEDRAADCISGIAYKYSEVKRKLDNVDYNRVAEFIKNVTGG